MGEASLNTSKNSNCFVNAAADPFHGFIVCFQQLQFTRILTKSQSRMHKRAWKATHGV